MTKLSVNINKIATLRNSRGGKVPDLLKVATDIQEFGAQGITIHPRPDERHIRYRDAHDLKPVVTAEWDTITHQVFLKDIIAEFKKAGIRTSIFIDTDLKRIEAAAAAGTDRIELYTEHFATEYSKGNNDVVKRYREAAILAHELGLGINAGHDLNLKNNRINKLID